MPNPIAIRKAQQTPINENTAYQYATFSDYLSAVGTSGLRSKDIRRFKVGYKRAMARYEKRMEQWRQRSRRTTVTQQGVQRRAFFEPEAPAPGGMRTTTGAQ